MKEIEELVKKTSGEDWLKRASGQDILLDHNIDKCGMCYSNYIWAETAREMIKEGRKGDLNTIMDEHIKRFEKRWKESKYRRLWDQETSAGRDQHDAFKAFGWIP